MTPTYAQGERREREEVYLSLWHVERETGRLWWEGVENCTYVRMRETWDKDHYYYLVYKCRPDVRLRKIYENKTLGEKVVIEYEVTRNGLREVKPKPRGEPGAENGG